MDLLIRGGMLFDGSGAAGVQRDVAIRDGRIVALGAEAAQAVSGDVLDAGGLAVAPGFIDLHSHADHTLPTFPRATNSISQGVTTEVVGLCGFSVAPVAANPSRAEQLRELASGIGPYLEWNWHTFDDYLHQFQAGRARRERRAAGRPSRAAHPGRWAWRTVRRRPPSSRSCAARWRMR